MSTLLGLSGRRGVGKSVISEILVRDFGFTRVHPFSGGKVASKAYFAHLGADADMAERMVNGDLKDLPSHILPENASPRFFMERFGKFMATTLGPDWTIGQEIRLAFEADPDAKLLVDSVVYEADVIRARGGVVVKIERDGPGIEAIETDAAVRALVPDILFQNNGDDLATLPRDVDLMMDAVETLIKERSLTFEI